jgi:hypothetical protein
MFIQDASVKGIDSFFLESTALCKILAAELSSCKQASGIQGT